MKKCVGASKKYGHPSITRKFSFFSKYLLKFKCPLHSLKRILPVYPFEVLENYEFFVKFNTFLVGSYTFLSNFDILISFFSKNTK